MRNRFFAISALTCILFLTVSTAAWSQAYQCLRAESKITIDGQFNDAAWQKANWTEFKDTFTGGTLPTPGKCALLWDSERLYVAWDVKDTNILASIYVRDERVWVQDVVEIFLDPMKLGRVYYEFQMNAIDNIRDVVIMHSGKGAEIYAMGDWDSNTEFKTTLNGTLENNQDTDVGWTCEMAIPLKELWLAENHPPMAGDIWRFNVYWINYGLEKPYHGALQPTIEGSYHTPWRFGYIEFK